MKYKRCIVPDCSNNNTKSPKKLFFWVPLVSKIRRKWSTAMKIPKMRPKKQAYCCEDHFNLEDDVDNYVRYVLHGGPVKLKNGVLPHKFLSQEKPKCKLKPMQVTIADCQNLIKGSSTRTTVACLNGANSAGSSLPADFTSLERIAITYDDIDPTEDVRINGSLNMYTENAENGHQKNCDPNIMVKIYSKKNTDQTMMEFEIIEQTVMTSSKDRLSIEETAVTKEKGHQLTHDTALTARQDHKSTQDTNMTTIKDHRIVRDTDMTADQDYPKTLNQHKNSSISRLSFEEEIIDETKPLLAVRNIIPNLIQLSEETKNVITNHTDLPDYSEIPDKIIEHSYLDTKAGTDEQLGINDSKIKCSEEVRSLTKGMLLEKDCEDDLGRVCRCCLAECTETDDGFREIDIEVIKENLNLIVSEDDRMSRYMCPVCVDFLQDVKTFRANIIESEARLLQVVCRDKRGPQHEETDSCNEGCDEVNICKEEMNTEGSLIHNEDATVRAETMPMYKHLPDNKIQDRIKEDHNSDADVVMEDDTIKDGVNEHKIDTDIVMEDSECIIVIEDERSSSLISIADKGQITEGEVGSLEEEKYKKVFHDFDYWIKANFYEKITDRVILQYFQTLSMEYTPATLQFLYSIMKLMLRTKKVDVPTYSKLIEFLDKKSKALGLGIRKRPKRKPLRKKLKFSDQQIQKFLKEAPDCMFLMTKVAFIFSLTSGLVTRHLRNILISDVEVYANHIIFHVDVGAKERSIRKAFTVWGRHFKICKKYIDIRPIHCDTPKFFLAYKNGQCETNNVSFAKLATVGCTVAEYLSLPRPISYPNP